ncbi:MAG TPA: acetate--CoA ligase [Candidatus Polarisedimenticolia bacterium]|nr:acetate--CoA ligase [Candidatus Polarisedimenticolia bacterium]
MAWQTIVKSKRDWAVPPNLPDYEQGRRAFSWDKARQELNGLPGGHGLNIAFEAVERHAKGPRCNHLAIRWLGKNGEVRDYTYGQLQALTNRFANVLRGLGVKEGDHVYALAGRIPELYLAALGTLKHRSVFCPLFSAFGPEPIRSRLTIGRAKVLVTTESLYERKVKALRPSLPFLEHVLLVGDDHQTTNVPNTVDLHRAMGDAEEAYAIEPTDPEEIALLHFTSGTTGTPKGAVHVHAAVVAHHITGKLALDFHCNDIFWCTADPGWVTGTSYGIIAPLTNGITSIVDEGDFEAERWYGILQSQKVTVWYSAPTAIRMLMKSGSDLARKYDLHSLRFLSSVGEPLNPEAVVWSKETFGLPFHDNWWQTETGGIMIANFAAMDVRPGSMGRPLPGIEAAIVKKNDDGSVEEIREADVQGELALRPGWPSMFRAYWNEPERYKKCFAGGFYLTGDLAKRDTDGYFWFIGRKDDVIKTSGHLIGPFEVESILMEHKAVAESAVIGKPDPVALEIVKAFVVLHPGYEPSEELRREIMGFARSRLGAVVAPKEIEFVASVPKTRSGKIMRRLLKARELGLPEGDTSTLEID